MSLDEEHVAVVARDGRRDHDLGTLAHNYLLLTLARVRRDDERSDLPASEQGWVDVDRLLKMLRVDENKLNVDVHRARKRLAATGVDGAAGIIERRPARRMRLGLARFTIRQG